MKVYAHCLCCCQREDDEPQLEFNVSSVSRMRHRTVAVTKSGAVKKFALFLVPLLIAMVCPDSPVLHLWGTPADRWGRGGVRRRVCD